jgi:hypothetical protein
MNVLVTQYAALHVLLHRVEQIDAASMQKPALLQYMTVGLVHIYMFIIMIIVGYAYSPDLLARRNVYQKQKTDSEPS